MTPLAVWVVVMIMGIVLLWQPCVTSSSSSSSSATPQPWQQGRRRQQQPQQPVDSLGKGWGLSKRQRRWPFQSAPSADQRSSQQQHQLSHIQSPWDNSTAVATAARSTGTSSVRENLKQPRLEVHRHPAKSTTAATTISIRHVVGVVDHPPQSALDFLQPPNRQPTTATGRPSLVQRTKTSRVADGARRLFSSIPRRRLVSQPKPHRQRQTASSSSSLPVEVATPLIPTRVGALAHLFEHVLIRHDTSNTTTTMTTSTQIDLPRLLAACQAFEVAMVQVGQGLSAKDLRNNIRKTLDYYQTMDAAAAATTTMGGSTGSSDTRASTNAPTTVVVDMRTVLQAEKDTHIHDYSGGPPQGKLHLLKDPSCAMGLLWIRRSLQFQYTLFTQLLHMESSPTVSSSAAAAAASLAVSTEPKNRPSETELASRAAVHAYEQTLQPYHGFALRQLYHVAVQTATPSRHEWLARLGGFAVRPVGAETSSSSPSSLEPHSNNETKWFGPLEEEATRRDLQHLLDVWKPLIDHWVELYAELDLEDLRRV